ncbi:hypothetical protein C6P45_005174 [Maudiozyma exigua]|uniref:SH3 domain-containing protein n=1 Tax=Maudiozyma exigua TaxID=34358 RepID=A0A9P7B9F1_MAUEX|nr:hypothetical protein C6P45_005174 [Kazachstania exigua]
MATKIAGLSDERAEILHDPMLVEDFSDVVRPTIRAEESGSVVMTPTSAAATAHVLEHDDMDYSDSEFEDNLEQRMLDLRGGGEVSSTETSLNEARTELRNKLEQEGPSLEFSDDEDDGEEEGEDNDDDDDDEEEEEFQPLAPPQELDPDKLYALYAFNGPDTSHCPLEQDESCLLLNDQDSYWWLVKRVRDNRIGFAPAEILETFPERLARLNCWKNENLSSSSRLDEKHKTHLENYNNNGKSVSFNDIVSYADRYVDDDTIHEDTFGNEATRFNDEISDTVSDVSFSTGYTQPLEYKKTRRSPGQVEEDTLHDDIEGLLNPTKITSTHQQTNPETSEDDLTKVFEAPVVPFKQNKLHTSRSENSISSIGEFSPSSSDQTNDDSPRELATTTVGSPRQRPLPQSHALHHISNIVTSSSSSTPSSSPATSHEEFDIVPSTKDGPHPTIVKIYKPFFLQIDTLIMHLDTLLHPQPEPKITTTTPSSSE